MKHCDKKAVTVNVTNKCNLRCTYCMANSAAEQSCPRCIDLQFAKAGIIDAINGYPSGVKADTLRFFSPGEPTQAMEIIRDCVVFAKMHSPSIKVELQTNGLFESREDTEWIANNIDIVWFSLDGPPEINGENRPDEFGNNRTAEIEENLKIVKTKTQVGIRATVTQRTVGNQDKLVEYYHNLGVRHLAFNPLIKPIKRGDHGNIGVNEMSQMDFARGFCDAHKVAQQLNVELTNSLTFNFDEVTEYACRSCLPMPQLNPDGSVSSCDMAMYRDTKKELQDFLYGEWNEATGRIDYFVEKIDKLRSRKLCNLERCKNCKYGAYCAGGCVGRIAFDTGDIFGYLPDVCAATHYMAKRIPLGLKQYTATHP